MQRKTMGEIQRNNSLFKEDVMKMMIPVAEEEKAEALQMQGIKDIFLPRKLHNFTGVVKHKSVWRAMKRGNVSLDGQTLPRKPFNNRLPTRGRKDNELKKEIYGEYRRYQSSFN